MVTPSAMATHGEDELEDELPAGTDLPAVVDEAERRGERGAAEQRHELAADVDPVAAAAR